MIDRVLIQGDPMNPSSGDRIAETMDVKLTEPQPSESEGWRLLTGNTYFNTWARVALRYEIEES